MNTTYKSTVRMLIRQAESEDYFTTYEATAEAGIQAACEYLIEKNKEQ